MITIKVQRVEQTIIRKTHPMWKTIDTMCFNSKNLYNYSNYIIRQEFINNGKWIQYYELFKLVKKSKNYKNMGSNTGQATLRLLEKNWKSFFKSIKDWKKNPYNYLSMPKIPKYKSKQGRFVFSLDNNKVRVKDSYLYFSWKQLKQYNNCFKTNIKGRLIQCRFIPRGENYIMELVYEKDIPNSIENHERLAAIDIGVENFVTIANNIGEIPIIIKGGTLKSINQYYNKKKAIIQSNLKQINNKNWSQNLARLTNKRFEKIKYQMHCNSKLVVDYLVANKIETLVVGRNNKWKQKNSGMQNFTYIPYDMLLNMLKYKCEDKGITFIITEESYTSGTSFLDRELPLKENYDKNRRVCRGLFESNKGLKINADVNGAYQILIKVFPNAFAEGIEGVGLHPLNIKKYHKAN